MVVMRIGRCIWVWGLVGVVLVGGGCSVKEGPLKDLLRPIIPPTPSEAARGAFDVADPDTRRKSVAMLSAAKFGGEAPYVRMYRLLLDDPDATVRAGCVRALGDHGTAAEGALIVPYLKDEDAVVRWEAARAMQKIHAEEAVGLLIAVVGKDEDADVRMAAAAALGQYWQPRVYQALVGALDDYMYGVAAAAQGSLKTLTGQEMGADGRAWLAWSKEHGGDLFAGGGDYTWVPYRKHCGWFDKIQFWKKCGDVTPRPAKDLGTPPETPGTPGSALEAAG